MHRRQFQPKANVPMGTDSYKRLALQLHTSCATLIDCPSPESFNQLSKMFAALCNVGMAGEAMDLATDTMSDICDRYEQHLVVTVTECEAEWLQLAVASIDDRLHQVPVNRLAEAVSQVEMFCAFVGAESKPYETQQET